MKNLLRLEEVGEFLFSIFLFSLLPFSWWVFPLLLMAPDLSLITLLMNKPAGTALYNTLHLKALALALYVIGQISGQPALALVGVILLGHSSFDRALGLGLMHDGTFTHAQLKLFGKPTRAA